MKDFCVKTAKNSCDNDNKDVVRCSIEEDQNSSYNSTISDEESPYNNDNKQNCNIAVNNNNTSLPRQRNTSSECVAVDNVSKLCICLSVCVYVCACNISMLYTL